MPEKINNEDLDSFLKSHLKSIPERELTDDDERQMISNIIMQKSAKNLKKDDFFSQTAWRLKYFLQNIYDGFRIGNIRVLSPQFAIPIILIIAVSVFVVIKYTGTVEKKEQIITKKSVDKEPHLLKEKSQEQDLAQLDKETFESINLKSIPLIYSDRGSSQDSTISKEKINNVFLLVKDILKENGIGVEKQITNSKIITEWVIYSGKNGDETKQQRLVFNYNSRKNKIDVTIEQKPREVMAIKKKNLNYIYKKIDAEIYQMLKLSK